MSEPMPASEVDKMVSETAAPTDETNEETAETVILTQFELTLLLPTQSFVEPPQLNAASKNANEDGFLELPLPVGFTDPIHELKQLITESPEGFWLGSFGLAPVYADQVVEQSTDDQPKWGPWKKVLPPSSVENQAEAWRLTKEGVLGEYADLQNVFGLGDWQSKRRGLKVVPTTFTPLSTGQHVLRLRDTLYSLLPTAPPTAGYDPTALAVRAGSSLYAQVRGQSTGPAETESEEGKGKGKGKKTEQAVVKADQAAKTHPFADWHYDDLNAFNYLKTLQSETVTRATTCLKSFGLSQWGPPPHARRLRGDLVYLTAVTLEGDAHEIIGSVYGFFVSSSNSGKFDPSPRKTLPKGASPAAYHSLFELLAALSPLFSQNLAAVLKAQNPPHVTPDIFATIQISHAMPAVSHLLPRPTPTADPFRSQLAYLLTGSSTADQLPPARDWNEEFTQSKEMPKASVAERLVRERCKQRVQSDFVSAATKGAVVVARGDVPPLNPNEPVEAHTFLHNNMLFTRAEDQLESWSHVGGREAARIVANKDVAGLTILERLDVDGLNTMPTVVVDYLGERWVVQSLIPGLFKTKEGELDADGNPVVFPEGDEDAQKAAEEARKNDKPFPSEATPNKDDYPPGGSFRIVYGGPSPDTPEDPVRASAYFHKLAKKVADEMHFAEHEVTSHDGSKVSLYTSVDVHGVAAPDGRSYLIDLARMHCTDVEFLEQDVKEDYPHRMTLLRAELVEGYRDSKLKEWIEEKVRVAREKVETDKADKTKSVEDELKEASQDSTGEAEGKDEKNDGEKKPTTVIDASEYKLSFNPDAFAERKPLASGTKIEADDTDSDSSKAVRDASKYLRDTMVPGFASDYVSGLITVTDGFQLTKMLHRRGINLRYLGAILDHAFNKRDSLTLRGEPSKQEIESNVASLITLLEHEMVVRSAKHMLNEQLRQSHQYDHSAIISHFFNCLLVPTSKPVAEVAELPSGVTGDRSWSSLTPTALQESISRSVSARFRHQLSSDFFTSSMLPRKVFRELALRVGVQFELRDYQFGNAHASATTDEEAIQPPAASTTNKKKKKKASTAANGHAAASTPAVKSSVGVRADDVINIVPITKAAVQRSPLADENFHSGHRYMLEGQVELGQDMMTDALSLYEQVFGTVHPEAAARYHALGVVYNQLGNAAVRKLSLHNSAEEALRDVKPEQRAASLENLKHIMLAEPDVVRAEADTYFNSAARVVRQSLIISERVHGVDSFDAIQQYNDLAILEQAIGNTDMALRLTLHTINLWAAVYGPAHPNILNLLSSAATMIQTMPEFGVAGSLPILQECLKATKVAFGERSPQYASVENNVGQAYGVMNEWEKSLEHIDASVKIYTETLGAEAKETVDAQNLYKIVQDAQSREGQEQRARDERLRRRFPRVMQIRDNRRLAASGSTTTAAQANDASMTVATTQREHGQKADLSVDELVSFIQGTPVQSSTAKANRKRKGSPDQAKSKA